MKPFYMLPFETDFECSYCGFKNNSYIVQATHICQPEDIEAHRQKLRVEKAMDKAWEKN